MTTLAIRGHATRGKEMIHILEMLGGKNAYLNIGNNTQNIYYINTNNKNWIWNEEENNNKTSDYTILTLEEFLEKFPYKVGDRVLVPEYESEVRINNMIWDGFEIQYSVFTDEVEWYSAAELNDFNDTFITMEDKHDLIQQLKEYFENTPREVIEKEWHEYDKYNEIGPDVIEYLEYVNNIRQPKYPKTYGECCEVVNASPYVALVYDKFDGNTYSYDIDNLQIYENLRKLKICRNAYWKVAGEKMGLGKSWEPDWLDPDIDLYVIINVHNQVEKAKYGYGFQQCFLTFPTEKIRDTFFENFKELIEECKGLFFK